MEVHQKLQYSGTSSQELDSFHYSEENSHICVYGKNMAVVMFITLMWSLQTKTKKHTSVCEANCSQTEMLMN